MTKLLPGATKSPAYKFEGDEIAALVESPQLVRWGGLANDHVQYLAIDIAVRGQQTPVLVRRTEDGRAELVAGRHRRAAVLAINADPSEYDLDMPIPLYAVYRELDDEQAVRASFAENTTRPLTCMDLAHTAVSLADLGWGNKEIAAALTTPHHRMSASRVSQLRALIRLPMSVQTALHLRKLPESAARAMLRLDLSEEDMQTMADRLEKGEIKAGEIIALANRTRRDSGAQIRRTLHELRAKLDEMGTSKAMDLLAWLDGEIKGDTRIEEIFEEEE